MNRKKIKQLSSKMGASYKDLIALAPQNDPFYCGSPAQRRDAEWFADVWNRAGYRRAVHLRRVHYWAVSQEPALVMPVKKKGSAIYRNIDACWQYLIQAAKYARYLGLVDIRDIKDNKNPEPHLHARYSYSDPFCDLNVPELNDPDVWIGGAGLEVVDAQPYHLEIWCEKSTMDDVLLPVCQMFNANLVTFEGEVSITACSDLIYRIAKGDGRPARVFYISDFDPAGNSMPAAMSRKVEYLLHHHDLPYDVKIKPLALTLDQVQRYRLPRAPIKDSELRADSFEEAFGAGATELDALEARLPGELATLTERALSQYYSSEAAQAVRDAQEELRQAVREEIEKITSQYGEEIDALEEMIQKLRAVDVDAAAYAVKRFKPGYEWANGWLFDSGRSYVDQIAYYKAHKGE